MMNKKIIFALLPLLGLTSCSQENSFNGDEDRLAGEPREIVLSGSFGEIGGSVTPDTRASVDGTSALNLYFVRRDKNTTADSWPSYGTTVLPATRVAGANYQAIAFTTKQYYPMEKLYGDASSTSYNQTRFIGWYPQAASFSGNVVKIAVNGTNDILLSNEVTGSYASQFTSSANQLTFSHQLAKVTVQVKAADADAPARWGKVTAIKVKNQPTTCDITLPTTAAASVTWTGNSAALALEGMGEKTLTTANQTCGAVLIQPTSGKSLTLEVTTEKGDPRDITVSLASGTFAKGTAYTVTLEFKSTMITPSATVSGWTSATNNPSIDL